MSHNHLLKSPSREDLSQMLESIYVPEWRVVSQTFIINDIERFAEDIRTFAEEYGLDAAAAWSNLLQGYCRDYDILKIGGALEGFAALVQEITGHQDD